MNNDENDETGEEQISSWMVYNTRKFKHSRMNARKYGVNDWMNDKKNEYWHRLFKFVILFHSFI